MLAAVLTRPGLIEVVERPEPRDPGVGEALVAVHRVGICGTDLHAYTGRQNFFGYPRVLGHELAVEVLALGEQVEQVEQVDQVRVGDRCAVLPYLSCGGCPACRSGRRNCCDRIEVLGVTVDGGLCERLVLPAAQLYCRPGLSLDQLVLVETLGVGWHAVQRARPQATDTVLVLGAGPIGLAVAQCVQDRVAQVLVGDVSAERVAFAAGLGLATVQVDDELPRQVADRHGGGLPTLVFDASGSRASMEHSFELVSTGGTLVLVGHTNGPLTFHNPGVHARELDLRASRNATSGDWVEVLDAVDRRSLDAVPWINHRSSLRSVERDLPELAAAPGRVVKSVVEISEAVG